MAPRRHRFFGLLARTDWRPRWYQVFDRFPNKTFFFLVGSPVKICLYGIQTFRAGPGLTRPHPVDWGLAGMPPGALSFPSLAATSGRCPRSFPLPFPPWPPGFGTSPFPCARLSGFALARTAVAFVCNLLVRTPVVSFSPHFHLLSDLMFCPL